MEEKKEDAEKIEEATKIVLETMMEIAEDNLNDESEC